MTKVLIGFKCFFCKEVFGPECAEFDHYMPCGHAYSWILPDRCEIGVDGQNDRIYTALGRGKKAKHLSAELATEAWRKEVIKQLQVDNCVYQEVNTPQSVTPNVNTEHPYYWCGPMSKDYPGLYHLQSRSGYVFGPKQDKTLGSSREFFVCGVDPDVIIMILIQPKQTTYYAAHFLAVSFQSEYLQNNPTNFYGIHYCRSSISWQEAAHSFIKNGKLY